MTYQDVVQIVDNHIGLIEVNPIAMNQSKERAAKFLVVQAILSNHIKELQDVKAQVSTLEKATYAQCLMTASGKNVTENKIMAEAHPDYAKNREALELIDSELNWCKQHFDIFNNAHVMFRQFSKE